LTVGHSLGAPTLLFEKIEDEVINAQIKKLNDNKKAMELANQPAEPAKPEISFDDFQKMDIRVGTILQAERVEKSKKLLKLQVDTGIDTRTVMSGIAEHFSPEEVTGKQVTILVNLAPRKIMGVESQ
ncbi:MAG: methionine--tRNA ligase, partial [Bacteroidota bacterium]